MRLVACLVSLICVMGISYSFAERATAQNADKTALQVDEEQPGVGLQVGDMIPTGFEVLDVDGKPVKLQQIMGEKGAILLFVRSLEWCPYCISQVKEWSSKAPEIKAMGYHVSSISYDLPETIKHFTDKQALQLSTLSDAKSKMIMEFGILNTTMKPGTRFYGIPHPTIYVVDRNGKITHRFAEEGYKERPLMEDVLADLAS